MTINLAILQNCLFQKFKTFNPHPHEKITKNHPFHFSTSANPELSRRPRHHAEVENKKAFSINTKYRYVEET
jgi:hypothetical protein